jgi:hypothetical protein
VSYAEAFIEELKGFADGVAQGKAVRNSAEEAARDMDLLCGLARFRVGNAATREKAGRVYETT